MQAYNKNPEQNLLALKALKSISTSRSRSLPRSTSGLESGSGSGSGSGSVSESIAGIGGELRLINSFQGFGGLGRELTNPDFQKRLALFLKPHEIDSLKKSASSAYFTPKLLVRFVWAMVAKLGFKGGSVLEPAAGTGAFLDFMPNSIALSGMGSMGGGSNTIACNTVIAIEKDVLTSKILKLKHPGVQVINCGFEQFAAIPESFDLIIGNPPYSADKLDDVWQEEINDLAVHHAFVAKSSLMLKEGGLIAMVLPQFFMDNTSKHARDIIARNGVNLVCAFRLPDNCFANAKVSVDLVFLQKGKATIPWTKTVNSGFGNQQINEYFATNPNHILGNLEVIRMYERWGLTCRAQGNLRTKLIEVYRVFKACSYGNSYGYGYIPAAMPADSAGFTPYA